MVKCGNIRIRCGWAMEGGLCILFMAIMFDRFSMAFSKTEERLPSDVQKFYLLPQNWSKYQIARLLEKPLTISHDIVKYICLFITNLIAYFLKFLISIFNKISAENIGEFISKRYYVIPSFLVFALIIVIDTYFIKIGSFPEEWRLSDNQLLTL